MGNLPAPVPFPKLTNHDQRGFYALTVLGAIITVAGIAVILRNDSFSGPLGSHGVPFLLELGGIIAIAVGPIFLIIAMAILPTARQTARDLEEFRAGRALVHWVYTSQDLYAYTNALFVRWRTWTRIGAVILALIGIALSIAIASGPYAWENRILCAIVYSAAGFAGAFFIYALVLLLLHYDLSVWHRQTVHAFISANACNFAGRSHAHWNVKRRFMQSVLDDAAIVEGEPSMLVLTISTRIGSPRQDDAAHIALTLAAGAAALAGYHSHGPAKNAPRRMEIPIPRGCEEEARALAKSLQSAGPANSDILHI